MHGRWPLVSSSRRGHRPAVAEPCPPGLTGLRAESAVGSLQRPGARAAPWRQRTDTPVLDHQVGTRCPSLTRP